MQKVGYDAETQTPDWDHYNEAYFADSTKLVNATFIKSRKPIPAVIPGTVTSETQTYPAAVSFAEKKLEDALNSLPDLGTVNSLA